MRKRNNRTFTGSQEVVGLIPAGGTGSRIAPLPMSKELYPIGFQVRNGLNSPRPKVVSHYLLDKYSKAGIRKTFIIIRHGKWDIPAYFGDGSSLNLNVCYLMMKDSFGPPFTLDQAYPFVRENLVAFGFPDILFGPDDIFQRLLSRQKSESSDIVLGLYRPHDPKMMDMVEMAKDGMVRAMYLKPENSKLKFAWLCAVWTPVFSQFMHDFIRDARQEYKLRQFTSKPLPIEDVSVGAVIQNAIQKGLRVHGVSFRNEQYLDIGTPKDLAKAVKLFGWQSY